MMTVYLSDEDFKRKKEVEAWLEELALHDVNFSNRDFKVVQDDENLTWIDGIEEPLGTQTFNSLLRIFRKP